MPATATYSPTGDPYIDGVLGGTKWAVTTLTFSFPTDPAFYGSGYSEPTNNSQTFADFDSVIAAASQAGSNTVITLDTDNTLTLTNVMLHHDDFSFT